MTIILIILGMSFLHVINDYNLQGWLASAKQKKYWEDNASDPLYKNDYIMALFMHSFSWSFMIMIVPFVYAYLTKLTLLIPLGFFFVNLGIHMYVDDLKANELKINLIQDQIIHIIQIILTALFICL